MEGRATETQFIHLLMCEIEFFFPSFNFFFKIQNNINLVVIVCINATTVMLDILKQKNVFI